LTKVANACSQPGFTRPSKKAQRIYIWMILKKGRDFRRAPIDDYILPQILE
jgi:hypothetical protein